MSRTKSMDAFEKLREATQTSVEQELPPADTASAAGVAPAGEAVVPAPALATAIEQREGTEGSAIQELRKLVGVEAEAEVRQCNMGGKVVVSLYDELHRQAVLREAATFGGFLRGMVASFVADWQAGTGPEWVTGEFVEWLREQDRGAAPRKRLQVLVPIEWRQTMRLAALELKLPFPVVLMAVLREGLRRLEAPG